MKVLHLLPSLLLPHQVLLPFPQRGFNQLHLPTQKCTEMQQFYYSPFSFNSSSVVQGLPLLEYFPSRSFLEQKLAKGWDLGPEETCIYRLANFPTTILTRISGSKTKEFLFLLAIFEVRIRWIQIAVLTFYQVCSLRQGTASLPLVTSSTN